MKVSMERSLIYGVNDCNKDVGFTLSGETPQDASPDLQKMVEFHTYLSLEEGMCSEKYGRSQLF